MSPEPGTPEPLRLPAGAVEIARTLTGPTPRPDDPHPYVHLAYGPWVPSGHQCGDIRPGGCDEPVDERRVFALVNGVGGDRLVGYELRDCLSCTPRSDDVPGEWDRLAKEAWDRHAATAPPGLYTHEGIRRAIVAAVAPAIRRAERDRIAAEIEARRCDQSDLCQRCRCRPEDAAIARGETS